MKRWLTAATFGLALFAGAAQADVVDDTPKPAEQAAPAMPTQFERTEALEDMRYKHLWIAYGAVWLLVFAFVFRTWRRSEATASELNGLKARLAELEGRSGGGGGSDE
ncbi:MAG: hypothetical protein KC620_08780 [Myxococcales bacterium]|nr:hypothetical protein [Myxococcales bacterium]